MKNIYKLTLFFAIAVVSISCSNSENNSLTEGELFEQSIIIKPKESTNSTSKSGEEARTFELVNYNEEYEMRPAYIFNGYAFNDDGKYNDEIAGDHIYTSYETFPVSEINKSEKNQGWIVSDDFKYFDSLQDNKFIISCKVRHVDCPEDGGFWDSDWGTGLGCFEFYDCEVSIEF